MGVEEMGVGSSEELRRSALVNWYLERVVGELGSAEEALERKLLVERVISRLVLHDHVLIALSSLPSTSPSPTGPPPGRPDSTGLDSDPILVLHPNFSLD